MGKNRARTEERSPRWIGPAILTVIILYAAVIGLLLLQQVQESPFSRHPVTDEEAYITQAQGILAGTYPGEKVFYQSPLYPYLLAVSFHLFDESYNAVRIWQTILWLLLIVVMYGLGKQLFGRREGLLAAALAALYGPMLNYNLLLLKVSPMLLLLGLFLLVGVRLTGKPERWWNWIVLGVLCALLLLLRDNILIFLVVVPLWILVRFRAEPLKLRAAAILLFLGGALVVVGPLVVRNRLVAGDWVISTSQGGANFFIGNNPIADGRYKTLPFVRPHPETEQQDFRAEAEKRAGRELKATEVSRFWFDQGFRYIRKNPGRWLALQWKKTRYFLSDFEIPDNHGFAFDRAHFLRGLHFAPLSFGILFPLALFGIAATWERRRELGFIYLFAIVYALSVLAFFVVGRYRIPIVVPLIPLAAAGLGKFRDALRGRSYGAIAGGVFLVLIVAGFCYLPTDASGASWSTEYYLLGNAYLKDGDDLIKAGEIEEGREVVRYALAYLEHSLQLNERNDNARQSVRYAYRLLGRPSPDDPRRHLELGIMLASREENRDFEKARFHLRRALELDPDLADGWNALGNIAFLEGDLEQARTHFMRALALVPDSEAYKRNLALTYQTKP
jgi:4-amino-4-deoxy-L-arabinose transferase-like glycosyltransferase